MKGDFIYNCLLLDRFTYNADHICRHYKRDAEAEPHRFTGCESCVHVEILRERAGKPKLAED